MKKNGKLITYLMVVIGITLLIIDQKYYFIQPTWKFFVMIFIFLVNGNELIQIIKSNKNEKTVK